jgi:hypothetical protein
MQERRKFKRRHIMLYARVFDRKTGKHLGYLGNLTVEGIMVISDEPIAVGFGFSLRIDLPEDVYNQPILSIEAQSRWCEPDIDPRFFNTGFALLEINPQDRALVEKIVKDFQVGE